MKAIILSVEFVKEYETKFGLLYLHKIKYDTKTAFYSSKKKEQTYFVVNKEAEFTEETKTGKNGDYFVIKQITQNKQSNFGRALKKEQSRYSGFATAYSKDLVVSGRIPLDQMEAKAWDLFNLMVEMDKTIES